MKNFLNTIEKRNLRYLIECRQDLKGSTYFMVSSSVGRLRFHSMDAVLDFVNSNDLGYVE